MLELFQGELTLQDIMSLSIPEVNLLYEQRIKSLKQKNEAQLMAEKLQKDVKRNNI